MEEDRGPVCAHHRRRGRSRSCPQDMRTPGRPVRGITGEAGQHGGCTQAPRRLAGHAYMGGSCQLTQHLWGGEGGPRHVGGALAPGLTPPLRPPIGQARASSHAACLLARACKRRAPLVCSGLGTKFKDFKSTSWRLLRAKARRSCWPPHLHWSPGLAA